MKNKKLFSTLAIIFTLISVFLFAYLSNKHFALKSGTTAGSSLCNINDAFNCDAVSASTYSEFLSIPMAVWGLMAQVSLLILLLIYRLSSSVTAARMSYLLATLNVVAVVVMGSISILFLNTYCLFCLLSYITLILTFICIIKFQDSLKLNFNFMEDKIYYLFLLAIPVASYIYTDVTLGESYRAIQKGLNHYIRQWQSAPEKQIPALESVSMGASEADAKMTIVEFADFNCIHCKHAAPVLHSFIKSHPGTRLVFYHFPLDGGCNAAIERPGVSCDMAKAVFCGHKLSDKGWEGQKAMFETEKPLNLQEATDLIVTATGIKDTATLSTCMNDPNTLAAIQNQAKLGVELGVRGTPTIFANQKLLQGGNLLPVLQEAYKNLSSQ